MKYFAFFESDDNQIRSHAGGAEHAVFPATKNGIDALRMFATVWGSWGEGVENGQVNLYVTEAPEATELPFEMNLNYVDLENAKTLDDKNLRNAIQVLSQYDPNDIINSGDYIDIKKDPNKWVEDPNKWKMNHSREQLISLLSSVAKTWGPVVTSEKQHAHKHVMSNQVLITVPMNFVKIPHEQALNLLYDEQTSFEHPFGKQNESGQEIIGRHEVSDEEDDPGEYGLGGDWWKNPQEAIKLIARLIDEDL